MDLDTKSAARANSAPLDATVAAALARLARSVGVPEAQAARALGPVSAPTPAPSAAPARPAKAARVRGRVPAHRAAAAQARGEAHRAHVRALGAAGYDPTDWDSAVWTGARGMYRSPVRCVQLLGELPRPVATLVRRAALGVERNADGAWTARRTWASVRARTVAAVAWALWRQGRASKRGGFARVTVGVSVGMLGALFTRLDGCRGYSRSWVGATHAGRSGREAGPLTELRRVGAFLATQPPASTCPAHAGPPRRGKDGVARRYAMNQYRWAVELADARGYALGPVDDGAILAACHAALPRRVDGSPAQA